MLIKILNKIYKGQTKKIVSFLFKKRFNDLFAEYIKQSLELSGSEKKYLIDHLEKEGIKDLLFKLLQADNKKLKLTKNEMSYLFNRFGIDLPNFFFQAAGPEKFNLSDQEVNEIIESSPTKEHLLKNYIDNNFLLRDEQIDYLVKEARDSTIILIAYALFGSKKLNDNQIDLLLNKADKFDVIFINYLGNTSCNFSDQHLKKIVSNLYFINKENNNFIINEEALLKELEEESDYLYEKESILEKAKRVIEVLNLHGNTNIPSDKIKTDKSFKI